MMTVIVAAAAIIDTMVRACWNLTGVVKCPFDIKTAMPVMDIQKKKGTT